MPTGFVPRLVLFGPGDAEQRRELYFFSLYRVFEAALLALVLFTPPGVLVEAPRHLLLGQASALVYLVASWVLLYWVYRRRPLGAQVMLGAATDIAAATLASHALPASAPGIALMLLFNVGSAALLLPWRYGLAGGALASAALIGEYLWSVLRDTSDARPLAERVMFAVSFMAIAMLTNLLGRQMRESRALAERRGAELADLAEVNELIIRRMRTGVLLVDGDGRIRLANEAAQALLGEHDDERNLALAAPELSRRMRLWLEDGQASDAPLRLGGESAEVLPRFARLRANGESVLVFLDDTALVSRRAESMTLATLGRFSASLAHEIRNPLAAISYATQLLEESSEISQGDRRLLQIIHQQCLRTNGIVESVLGIARRERANAEHVDLTAFARRFVEDYRQVLQPEAGSLQVVGDPVPVPSMVDPRHLQQILTVLVQNALTYGRLPNAPARVTIAVRMQDGRPAVEVSDRGPGIPEGNASQLFRPFFTTSEHGTGLGLYIARELARANDASLEYVPMPGGGSCFRLLLAGVHALVPA
ncbi:MAG TPA: ATP-binding protein [Xanthomonadaceae bacterium]|nr:ATP-binding protein [Xanthomonadaceae bacterium]